jgi:hypothetical protein
MKTKALFTLLFLMASLFAMAQNTDWEVHIGVSNKNEYSEDVIEYYDKGYYIEGTIGMASGWQIKTDANGNTLWNKYLEHPDFLLQGWSVAMDIEGNRYVAGVKFNNGTWPFVSKFNPCGEDEWCRILVDDELDSGGAIDIIVNEKDEIIILEVCDDELEIEKIFLQCLNTDGEVLWKKGYASKNNYSWIAEPLAYDLMEHNHEYYISGSCYWPFPSDTTHYFLRPLFIGIDSLFDEKWILPFNELDSVFGEAYYSIPLNDSIIIGVGPRWLEGVNMNSLLMFYNINGQELGYSQIPNNAIGPNIDFNAIRDIERVNDSLFISPSYLGIAGETHFGELIYDTSATLSNFSIRGIYSGNSDFTKTFDQNFVIATTITEPNNDKNILLYKIDKNLQFVPFDTNTYTYDSLCPGGIQSGTIDLSGCMVWTGMEEIPSPEEYYTSIATIPITAYPNPAETEITLAFENTEHHSSMLLECYNIYGQKVHSEKIYKGQQQTKLDVSNWSKGLYFAVVKSNGKVVGTERFVRR